MLLLPDKVMICQEEKRKLQVWSSIKNYKEKETRKERRKNRFRFLQNMRKKKNRLFGFGIELSPWAFGGYIPFSEYVTSLWAQPMSGKDWGWTQNAESALFPNFVRVFFLLLSILFLQWRHTLISTKQYLLLVILHFESFKRLFTSSSWHSGST